MKRILVLASACKSSGALTIYKQFLAHLPNYIESNRYYLFIDPSMPQPMIKNVEYILDSDHSYKHRIYMNKKGYMLEMNNRGITPDVIFSLQNTGCVTKCKQVLYYHQPLPFYAQKWNPFKRAERTMFLYKYFYPHFVRRTLNDRTDIIVQIPFIKKGFVKYFNFDVDRVHVSFPDYEKIDVDRVALHDYNNNCYNFIYPATPQPYKGHLTIAKALNKIREKDTDLVDKIRVHLTIRENDNKDFYNYITENNLTECFVFHGSILHDVLLSFYKASKGLLFPSTIETLGLPLLEAATFGLPIIASDLDYAREVTDGYEGIDFVSSGQYDLWADKIASLCKCNNYYIPLNFNSSNWPYVFELILKDK